MLISVITPTYNSQETIKKTVISLNKQSNCNFEHIVIDKFSYDETLKIIRSTSSYPVKIFKRKDKGISIFYLEDSKFFANEASPSKLFISNP